MKKLFLTLFTTLLLGGAFAQKSGVVTGILVDSTSVKTAVQYATVSIYKGTDTVLTGYRLSDDKGAFRLGNLDVGEDYRLVITSWMFKTFRKQLKISATQPEINLGTLLLVPKDNEVAEVEIVAERPPMIVRKDTIEFNAASFKTLPTAVVEDLFKKLPGFVIGNNGELQYNGKVVSRLLVDSKEFFGGDTQIATKNLPANIVDKVVVTDDEEAKRRDPDLLPANMPQVINLKLKKAIKKGAFGKIYAGGGLDEHFEGGGIMNFFRDTTQISILAYGNNINKAGFSMGDIQRIGGFSRSGSMSMMMTSDGGFAIDNISFGGLGSGLQTSAGAGANFNTITKGGLKINGKYFFGTNKSLATQLVNDNQTLGANRLITDSDSRNNTIVDNHNFGARLDFKLDSTTRVSFTPTISINPNTFLSNQTKLSVDGNNQLINNAITRTNREGKSINYNMTGYLWKDFKKKGRSFNMDFQLYQRENLENTFNNSNSIFYTNNTTTTIDQLRNNDVINTGVSISLNYNEPVSKKLTFTGYHQTNYLNNETALFTYFKDPATQNYDMLIPALSETVMQRGIKTFTRGRLRWAINKDLSIQPAVVLNTIHLDNRFSNFNNFEQNFNFVFPSLNIRYKILSLDYSPSFEEPSVQYIQPVANNIDPLFIQNGNTGLVPSKTHRITLSMNKYDAKRSMSFNVYTYGSVKNDGIIMSRTINAGGVQTSTPVNADGIKQFYANGSISKDFKNAKRQITLNASLWGGYNETFVEVNGIRSANTSYNFTPRMGIRLNLNDKFELSETYNFTINNAKYDDPFFTDRSVTAHGSETEMIIRYPKKIVFETNLRLQMNNQAVAGYNNNIKLWSAGITYLFMKNDRAQLKFSVNDILQNSVRRSVFITENSIRDTQTNNLGRYFLTTLTYNIQNFGAKVGGKERFFGF